MQSEERLDQALDAMRQMAAAVTAFGAALSGVLEEPLRQLHAGLIQIDALVRAEYEKAGAPCGTAEDARWQWFTRESEKMRAGEDANEAAASARADVMLRAALLKQRLRPNAD